MSSLAVPFAVPFGLPFAMLLALPLGPAAAVARASEDLSADAVVFGGTSAGVVAALELAERGRSVLLIAPEFPLGGLTVSGLGATDVGDDRVIGGRSRSFYQAVRAHYDQDAAWVQERRENFRGRGHRPGDDVAYTFEPKVAEAIFARWIADSSVVVLPARLDRTLPAEKEGNRLLAVRLVDGRRVSARIFLDASYEGDLLALAGVDFVVGRESGELYGESRNGNRPKLARSHQFVRDVDPYLVPGDPASGLLPGIDPGGAGEDGAGDARVQAYCYRICATDVPENRLPWPRPEHYDPLWYELLLRNFEAGDHRVPWNPVPMPNRKTDSNNNFAVSSDFLGQNHGYPLADDETRDAILARHRDYQQGLFWTLANDPRVPAEVREVFQRFGLAADEFVASDHWPPWIYVREARRMVSAQVMTEHHCLREEVVGDSVGMGAYNMDSHHVRRYVDESGAVRNEGDVQDRALPYPISYRSLVPRREQCQNLLVPVCLSATHIAYGSIRMEPVFQVLAHSAAVAADLALERELAVQDLDYAELREALLAEGQVLDLAELAAKDRDRQGVDPRTILGVVVDDGDATREGPWLESHSVPRWVGAHYLHDGDVRDGSCRAAFRATLTPGRHEVLFAYTAHDNRASAVRVVVHTQDGPLTVPVDERRTPPVEGLFVSLGTFAFGRTAEVRVDDAGADGHVVVDAVVFRPVPGDGGRELPRSTAAH